MGLGVVVRVEVEESIPETGLSSSKWARDVKSDLGIQYCGKKRCSHTRCAEVVSKIMWPLRRPRTEEEWSVSGRGSGEWWMEAVNYLVSR